MGPEEVNAYLTALAPHDWVSAARQNQALCAILFLYRHVLGDSLPWIDDQVRARRSARLPLVQTREVVESVLARIEGVAGLVARMLYGSGLRLLEALRLRVHRSELAPFFTRPSVSSRRDAKRLGTKERQPHGSSGC